MLYFDFENNVFKKHSWIQKWDFSGIEMVDYISDKPWYEEMRLRCNQVSPEDIIYEPFVLTPTQQQRLDIVNGFDGLVEYDIVILCKYMFEYEGEDVVSDMSDLKTLVGMIELELDPEPGVEPTKPQLEGRVDTLEEVVEQLVIDSLL